MSVQVLLDTDIGNDIDDAVCLAYLLANPACDLLGITTVTGEAEARAKIASAQCKAACKPVPIYPGAERPFLIDQEQLRAPQAAALERWPHDTRFPRGKAVEFMRKTVRAHPGKVVLIAIGPLTNVAALFMADQEIPSLLRALVIMNGVFAGRPAGAGPVEFNTRADPAAAAVVYRADVPVFRAVGLDVTCRVTMPAPEVRRRFRAPLLRPVLDFAEIFFKTRDIITFHDPLAAATVFDEKICGFERGRAEVELKSEKLAGFTHWKTDPKGRHEVALAVDPDRFFAHYFSFFEKA